MSNGLEWNNLLKCIVHKQRKRKQLKVGIMLSALLHLTIKTIRSNQTEGTFCNSQGNYSCLGLGFKVVVLFWKLIKNQLEIIKLNLLFWGLARSDKNPYHIKDVSMTTHNSFKYLGTSFITVMSFWQIRASIQSIMLILWFWFLILIYLEVCESSFIKEQFVWHYRFYQIQILKYLTLSAILMLMNAFNLFEK